MPNDDSLAPLHPDRFRVTIVAGLAQICRTAADEILRLVDRAGSNARPFTFALSGGTTPRRLHALMAGDPIVRTRLPWNDMHFFWGDERHVPPDHPQSNYQMAWETLLSVAPIPAKNIHRVPSEEPDATQAAKKYEQELKAFFELEGGQMPRFDCILLGMGNDGHTASLFPETGVLSETKRMVAAYWVEKLKAHRITLTVPVLNRADLIVFLVSGAEKAKALKAVLQGEYRPDQFPAQLIRPDQGELLWIVDQAAARCLTRFNKGMKSFD